MDSKVNNKEQKMSAIEVLFTRGWEMVDGAQSDADIVSGEQCISRGCEEPATILTSIGGYLHWAQCDGCGHQGRSEAAEAEDYEVRMY